MRKIKLVIAVSSIPLFIFSLTACGTGMIGTEPEVTYSSYTDRFDVAADDLPDYDNSYGIFISQSDDAPMYGRTLLFDSDGNDTIYVTVNHLGRKDDFTLSVFYDFQQVPFFVSAEDESVLTYRFELDNAQEIKIPIRLDLADSGHSPDEYRHKLLFSVIADATLQEGMQNCDLGALHMCELTYGNVTPGKYMQLSQKPDQGLNRFHLKDATRLVLNTDYENESIITNGYSAVQSDRVIAAPSELVKLMYSVTGNDETDYVLFFVTVGHIQSKINGEDSVVCRIEKLFS